MKRRYAFCSLLVLLSLASGCILGNDDKKSNNGADALVGTWRSGVGADAVKLIFYAEGTYMSYYGYYDYGSFCWYCDDDGAYDVSGNQVVCRSTRFTGDEDRYLFAISGNTLTLEQEGVKRVYTRR